MRHVNWLMTYKQGQLLCCHRSVQSIISFLPKRSCCIVLSMCTTQQFSHTMWSSERGWFSYFVLCGVFHYNEMHTEAFSFVLLQPAGYTVFSSLNTHSNDMGLTCCELLLAVPFPSEVWSGVAVHPGLFYVSISLFSALIWPVAVSSLPPSTSTWHYKSWEWQFILIFWRCSLLSPPAYDQH